MESGLSYLADQSDLGRPPSCNQRILVSFDVGGWVDLNVGQFAFCFWSNCLRKVGSKQEKPVLMFCHGVDLSSIPLFTRQAHHLVP